ncbi:hypothetical protein [Ensifer adhaerens]|uniref:hypothetical protein n=1 Tax=Ensifer adhaerens TaxID=106592 RepID=UPI00202F936B|nr:hypothetical protein [Ensifer adhaerens]
MTELLGDQFRRHEVDLNVTDPFRVFEVESYLSTLSPAFVNLVDNAIHWVAHGNRIHARRGSSK